MNIKRRDLAALCRAIKCCELDKNLSWENLNRHYHDLCHDRRYKAYFGSIRNDNSGIYFIGDPDRNGQRVYMEREGDTFYVRFAADCDYSKIRADKVVISPSGVIVEHTFSDRKI